MWFPLRSSSNQPSVTNHRRHRRPLPTKGSGKGHRYRAGRSRIRLKQDQLQGPDITLSYVDFARNLESLTAEPKSLRVFQNSADHGFELLDNVPEALDLLFLWLENNL